MANPGQYWIRNSYVVDSLINQLVGPCTNELYDYPKYGLQDSDWYIRSPNTNNPKSDSSGWRPPTAFQHVHFYRNNFFTTDECSRYYDFGPDGGCSPPRGTVRNSDVAYGAATVSGFSTGPDWEYPLPPPYGDGFKKLEDQALTKALLKLQNQQVNLATNFVERKQTVQLFQNACKAIAGVAQLFRRQQPTAWHLAKTRSGRKNFNHTTAGQKWLEFQYGWKPLASDLYGAANQIIKRSKDGLADRVTVTATSKEGIDYVYRLGRAANWNIDVHRVGGNKAHVSLSYRMDNPLIASLDSIGIINPAYVAWEEIPFSFVVDWFLPVGNWLNSLTAAYGWYFIGGSCGFKQEFTDRRVAKVFTPASGSPYLPLRADLNYYASGNLFSRTVYPVSPVPAGPHLKNPLSSLHVSEALALLQKAFR